MKNKKFSIQFFVKLALLSAIIIILAVTPIGYLPVSIGIKLTIIQVPVIVGAVLLGPSAGAFLGLVFGLTSFFQAPNDIPLGPAMLSYSVFATFLICVLPRVIMGFLSGLLIKAFQHKKISRFAVNLVPYIISACISAFIITQFGSGKGSIFMMMACLIPAVIMGIIVSLISILTENRFENTFAFGAVGLLGSLLNTVLFLGSIYLFLGNIAANALGTTVNGLLVLFMSIAGFNGILEAVASCIITGAVCKALGKINKKQPVLQEAVSEKEEE
ncbi:MAG: ECF transporter S component [Ruminococcaceae bacterium]|nr:ECF transporter S component [Oscillospiraceae bacterium]